MTTTQNQPGGVLITTIAHARVSRTTASMMLSYLQSIHEFLAVALEFLRGFQEAGWPVPVPPSPKTSSRLRPASKSKPLPSQIDQDIIVARHLALTATMRKLVRLEFWPMEGELWEEFTQLQAEAQSISDWFTRNHGVGMDEEGKREEMKGLEAVWEWYVEIVKPALISLVKMLNEALEDEMRWEVPVVEQPEKPLPSLPQNGNGIQRPLAAKVQSDAAGYSSSHVEQMSCSTALRPILKSLLTRRAHGCIPASSPSCSASLLLGKGNVHQPVRVGVGLRHKHSAEDDHYDRRSFRVRVERASDEHLADVDR